MQTQLEKKSQSRLYIAATLFLASIATSFAFAYLSHQRAQYWVVVRPVPAGTKLTSADINVTSIDLNHRVNGYLHSSTNPIGAITLRNLFAGELLFRDGLTRTSIGLRMERVSIPMRSVDLPQTLSQGDVVKLFHLVDVRAGEDPVPPQLILHSAYLVEVDRKRGNFGGEISVTFSIAREEVPDLLAATTSGRIVAVASGG
jgi:hypothetical protein